MKTQEALIVQLAEASRTYRTPAGEFAGIAEANLQVAPGEFVAIVGKSGSGKSTMMNLVTGVDQATSGTVTVAGREISGLEEDAIAHHRGSHVGVIFQTPHLIPTLSVLDNIVLPMDFVGEVPRATREAKARDLLAVVGLADQADKSPGALSGGQQQRVAIARSLANSPQLLCADEPTGSLDSETAEIIYALLRSTANSGTAVLMVTHDADAARLADRTVRVADGRIVDGEGA